MKACGTRCGLQPAGDDAKKSHEGVIKQVLQPGTKVSVLVRSHQPSEAFYTVERSVPNRPIVKDRNGSVLSIAVDDVLKDIQVFGQHEISELTKSREKLTMLLDRFVDSGDVENESLSSPASFRVREPRL